MSRFCISAPRPCARLSPVTWWQTWSDRSARRRASLFDGSEAGQSAAKTV